jgi:hypothetical protein
MTAGLYRVTLQVRASFVLDVDAQTEQQAIRDARTAYAIFGERVFNSDDGATCDCTAQLIRPAGVR